MPHLRWFWKIVYYRIDRTNLLKALLRLTTVSTCKLGIGVYDFDGRLPASASGGESPVKVRSWYGLNGEIEVENELWHLVKVGHVAVNHPPLINLVLRWKLPRADRLRLSYRHEFGHFQTLPIALAHVFLILWIGREQRRTLFGWLKWLAILAVANEAVWELASEAYVVVHDGAAYRSTYRQTPNRLFPVFWIAMGSLGLGLSRWLLHKPSLTHCFTHCQLSDNLI